MRTHLTALALFTACFWFAGSTLAQPFVVPYVGYALDAGYDNAASYLALDTDALETQGGVTLGLGVDIHVGWDRLPFILGVRPSAEIAIVPGESITFEGGESLDFSQRFWQAGIAVIGEVPVGRSPVIPYLGAGMTYARFSADFDAAGGASVVGTASVSAWEFAPSLLAGLRFGHSRVAPIVEARYRFATPSPTFSAERPGAGIDNGVSVVAGARIAL
jgi:opacity protein-like surface antigen